jgi:hypothetical protein
MIWNWRKERKLYKERLQERKLKAKGENERKEVEKVETISKLEWKSRKQCRQCRTALQGGGGGSGRTVAIREGAKRFSPQKLDDSSSQVRQVCQKHFRAPGGLKRGTRL